MTPLWHTNIYDSYQPARTWLLTAWQNLASWLTPTGALAILGLTIALVVGFGIFAWVRR